MKRRLLCELIGAVTAAFMCVEAASAAPPKDPPSKCAPDAVLVGSVCVDKYEASVWRFPDPLGVNKGLVKKVRKGTADLEDLLEGGATQLGVGTDDYAPCDNQGQACANDVFAVSLPGVEPASFTTWFQALEACTNSGKRLPSNSEWQAAANGTPDPGPDNGTTDCNTQDVFGISSTGARSSCLSARGAFDMVGNLFEWVADWVPMSTGCVGWGGFSATGDSMCLSGASTTETGPGALVRGGSYAAGGGFGSGPGAGPLTVNGRLRPSQQFLDVGFRCAR